MPATHEEDAYDVCLSATDRDAALQYLEGRFVPDWEFARDDDAAARVAKDPWRGAYAILKRLDRDGPDAVLLRYTASMGRVIVELLRDGHRSAGRLLAHASRLQERLIWVPFSDLSPGTGGEVWTRPRDEVRTAGAITTYERAPYEMVWLQQLVLGPNHTRGGFRLVDFRVGNYSLFVLPEPVSLDLFANRNLRYAQAVPSHSRLDKAPKLPTEEAPEPPDMEVVSYPGIKVGFTVQTLQDDAVLDCAILGFTLTPQYLAPPTIDPHLLSQIDREIPDWCREDQERLAEAAWASKRSLLEQSREPVPRRD